MERAAKGLGVETEFGLRFPGDRSKQVEIDAHPILDAAGVTAWVMCQAEEVIQQPQCRE